MIRSRDFEGGDDDIEKERVAIGKQVASSSHEPAPGVIQKSDIKSKSPQRKGLQRPKNISKPAKGMKTDAPQLEADHE